MPTRAFTAKPKAKAEDYHGACQINDLPAAFQPGSTATVPKSLNLSMSFEEALKFSVAVQSCVQSLNRYNRATKAGRDMGMGICIKFDVKQIAVMES